MTDADILDLLRKVTLPNGQDMVTAGLVRALVVDGNTARFVMEIDGKDAAAMEPVRAAAQAALEGAGLTAQIAMTAPTAKAPPPDLKPRKRAAPEGPQPVPGVRHIIAVASGKGGVGKSTVSANLAAAFAASGMKVGLLDADVYGPSQPRMLGVSGRPASPDGKIIEPKVAHGIKLMSMGLMVGEGEAVVWRGPMLMGALQQMLGQVAWGELDVLVIDLPPGTGDVQLTLGQKTKLTGAVVVSTPQDIALIDARKAINMFQKMNVPILGLIENMATHVCSKCGHEEHIFGQGGVRAEAQALGVPLLAEVPLAMAVRTSGDDGTPVTLADPDGAEARAFMDAANALQALLIR